MSAPRPEDADWHRHIGREWTRIQACMHDERISAMYWSLMEQREHDPNDIEGGQARMALIAEIDALGVEPREHEPRSPTSGYPMGCDTPHKRLMFNLYGPGKPLPGSTPAAPRSTLPAAEHAYCRSGPKCVIAVAGHGAALSPLTRSETNGSRYCIPCWRARQSR